MACHANTAHVRKYTKQNKQRKGKITSVAVVVSVKAEWDRVKRANGFSSNDEMIKCILGDLKRANVDSPKCCEPHNALAVSRSVKEEWDAVKRAYGYYNNSHIAKDLLHKFNKHVIGRCQLEIHTY